MPIVFQYGSNCDAQRLNGPRRLGGAATDLGRAKTVASFRIAFNKWSDGNQAAAADLIRVRRKATPAWGVAYELSQDALDRLAAVEGGGYRATRITITFPDGRRRNATTFVVRPSRRQRGLATSAAYVSHIVKGLRDHGVPETYVNVVIDTAVANNSNVDKPSNEEIAQLKLLRGKKSR